MSHEITLEQAMERAEQAEVIANLLKHYPNRLESNEVSAIAGLLARLSGNVFCWLSDELAEREKNNA
ncbi:hypothetical protein J5069_07570 [Candidatus Symbiopectobacterium sp. NZEC127]|uniref:hypothetical protein n=1 Tax=Candidatus Symbiopectobacterium sp. NZEC127 TaxID=2820472 RepID=UPI002227EFAB|nr:hypothetical protein [Candidatus Symbiopectobacterium sp. NZEC127]MCW2485755.1 hypothetical protein [Candidatus Symbiopectobacterium sp. NZEC127]